MTTGDGLLSAVDKWHEEGRQLRRQLQAERDELAMRLEEIDKRLADLPVDPGEGVMVGAKKVLSDFYEFPEDASVAHIVSTIIRRAEAPLIASEIIERVQAVRSSVKAEMVHSAIYRLTERGKITAEGAKGSRLFTWKEAT